jgi:trehalose-phosphatase
MVCALESVKRHMRQEKRLWLFLDYDGTLADFAPTPEHVCPDPELIDLLTHLVQHPHIRVAVVSGRRLHHVEQLVPVPGVFLAGTYGIELRTPSGKRCNRLDYDEIRSTLSSLKPAWSELIAGREGFFLEDKGWALALHARFASAEEAQEVLESARHMTDGQVSQERFRLLGGHRFLEIVPRGAHKGQTVAYLLDTYPWLGALVVYLGDDDKDEEAFGVVRDRGGIAVLVASEPRDTRADCRLKSPQAARRWLNDLLT